MVYKQIYKTNTESQLTINLPESFRSRKRVLVILDDSVDSKAAKMDLMKMASNDPLFLADIADISKDFKDVDSEFL